MGRVLKEGGEALFEVLAKLDGGIGGIAGGCGLLAGFALGLDGAQLVEVLVESGLGAAEAGVDAAQFGFVSIIEERVDFRVWREGREGGFGFVAALDVPGGLGELLEEDLFEGGRGGEFDLKGDQECVELFFLALEDDEPFGVEPVKEGVAGGVGFAFGGFGAGGFEGVIAIGADLGFGGHGFVSLLE